MRVPLVLPIGVLSLLLALGCSSKVGGDGSPCVVGGTAETSTPCRDGFACVAAHNAGSGTCHAIVANPPGRPCFDVANPEAITAEQRCVSTAACNFGACVALQSVLDGDPCDTNIYESDQLCVAGRYCKGSPRGVCAPLLADGQPCDPVTGGRACASGSCAFAVGDAGAPPVCAAR